MTNTSEICSKRFDLSQTKVWLRVLKIEVQSRLRPFLDTFGSSPRLVAHWQMAAVAIKSTRPSYLPRAETAQTYCQRCRMNVFNVALTGKGREGDFLLFTLKLLFLLRSIKLKYRTDEHRQLTSAFWQTCGCAKNLGLGIRLRIRSAVGSEVWP